MKKILTVLMMVFGLSAVFAYEPKKENAKVKRNGDFKYYEKTEPYEDKYNYNWIKDYKDYVCWVIRKGYTVEQCVDYNYKELETSRKSYYYFIEDAADPNPTSFTIDVTKLLNEMNGTDISPEERETKTSLRLAKKQKAWAIAALPFVTEENYLTLTKEEMIAKMLDFIKEVKAEKK